MELYDNLHTYPANDSILEQAAAILKSCYSKKMSIRVINVQAQKGIDDCGALAIDIAYNLDIEQVFIRRSFYRINFSEPQSYNRKSGRVLKALDVKLHCVCRLPDLQDSRYGDMACCDACKHWYHSGCVEIPVQVFVDPTMQWFTSLNTVWFCTIVSVVIMRFVLY